jgi:vacuolar-type H+-ATPase subunit I/STV1
VATGATTVKHPFQSRRELQVQVAQLRVELEGAERETREVRRTLRNEIKQLGRCVDAWEHDYNILRMMQQVAHEIAVSKTTSAYVADMYQRAANREREVTT